MKVLLNLLFFTLLAQSSVTAQTFQCVKHAGSVPYEDGGTAVTADASGNVLVTGYFRGTVDFDPGAGVTNLTATVGSDAFIQKLDAAGNLVWAMAIDGTSNSMGCSMVTD